MSRKTDAIVADAMEKSKVLTEAIPHGRGAHRTNAERIVAVCKDLVCARPVQEPCTPLVTGTGRIRFGKFPAEQSLLNRYGALLRIWRDAYRGIVDVSAPKPPGGGNALAIADEDLAALDYGTRSRITLMMAVLREQKVENDRLKKLLHDQVPAPGHRGDVPTLAPLPPGARAAIGGWLAEMEAGIGGLDIDDLGIRISRRARPNQLIVSAEVLEALRAICTDAKSSIIPSPAASS